MNVPLIFARAASGHGPRGPSSSLPGTGGVALVAAVSLGYAMEILFQPGVFRQFPIASIVDEIGAIFAEGLCVGLAMLLTLGQVERRAARGRWAYALQLTVALTAAAAVGLAIWAPLAGQSISIEAAPFLAGELLRLAGVGVFLAVAHGLSRRARDATDRQRGLALQAAALRADSELAQLHLLEAQIEPHFLFNTIANLRRTWHVDRDLGARMHDNAIRYLEASLPRLQAPTATLDDELALTRAYLELFTLRMGHRLRFALAVDPALGGLPFPRLSLLTLVENSIEHGIAPSADGGMVVVSAEADDASVTLHVCDDGVGFGGADTSGSGVGLTNVRSRLLAQYGAAAGLEIVARDPRGVRASIRVPRVHGSPA